MQATSHDVRMTPSVDRSPCVTVVVPLSGAHRLQWLTDAIDSVPLQSPAIEALHIVHSGGAWTWAPELRERLERHPKVRIFEFAAKVAVDRSLNRCMDTVHSRWGLLLPDDDALVPHALEQALHQNPDLLDGDAGLIAFGWYYRLGNRYRAEHVQSRGVAEFVRYTPKLCTTLVNVAHFQSLGGFEAAYGSYCDTVAYARLVHRFGAWTCRTPVGVYRLHEGQISVSRHAEAYLPVMDPTIEALSAMASTAAERQQTARRIARHAHDVTSNRPHGLGLMAFWLRSVGQPAVRPRLDAPARWSIASPGPGPASLHRASTA